MQLTAWWKSVRARGWHVVTRACTCCIDAQVQKSGYKTRRSKQRWVMPKMNYYEQPGHHDVLPGLKKKVASSKTLDPNRLQ